MRSRIFYFSATGNSLYAARRIALAIGAAASERVVDFKGGAIDEESDTVGFVFPVFFHRAPGIVLDFLRVSRFRAAAYAFAVATDNGEVGSSMGGIDAALRRAGSRLDAGFGLLMPGNSVIIEDYTNDAEERARRLAASEPELDRIGRSVLAGERNSFGRSEGLRSRVKSLFIRAIASGYSLPRHFRAGEDCSRCGICERACPRQNISIGDAGLSWGEDCIKCLACYHACPKRAINLDDYTKHRLRYRHPAIRPDELLYR